MAKAIVALRACVSLSVIAFAQAANAQVQAAPAGATQATAPAQQAQASDATAPASPSAADVDIIVTGSRIIRDGSQAPTPVTAVTADTLTAFAPTNLPDALNKLPQFTGSTSQTAGRTFNAGSAPLGNYLNLRGLGSQRVLILLNGQRVPPTNNLNWVDSNVIPQELVSRVDVVTGGGSAVYGSDAVSGVVNYVLDTKFEGVKLNAQAGIAPGYGDAGSQRLGATIGKKIGERIHVLASYSYYNNDGLPSIFDRDWAPYGPTQVGAGTAASPITLFYNARRNNLSNGGAVFSGALASSLGPGVTRGVMFLPNGSLAPFNPGATALGGPNGTTNLATTTGIGGDGGIHGEPRNGGTSIAGSLQTQQGFGRVGVDLTDTIEFHAQGIYSKSSTSFNSANNNNTAAAGNARLITIYADNPYLRPELAATLTAAGQPSFVMGRIFNDIPVVKNHTQTEFVSGQAGLSGGLFADLKWDVNYVYGRADQKVRFNEFQTRNFFAAVDAVRDPATGRTVCGVTLRNPGLVPGCVPINLLGDGSITQEAFNFTRADSQFRFVNTMQYVNANLRGSLFNLPAGPLQFAVGAEYRTQKLEQTSNSNPAIWADPTTGPAQRAAYFSGIRGVPANALLFNSINVGIGGGKQTVKEVYGELSVPLLKNTTGFQDLSLDLAGRLTDYKTSGSVKTWKVGVNWMPIEGIRFRGNQSRDIAAPSLNDLFSGQNIVVNQVVDPLTNVQVNTPIISSGNLAVRPEKGDTTTLGVVIQPSFLRGLTLSVDAYRVKVSGAIGTQSAVELLADCQSSATAAACGFITRPFPSSNTTPANTLTSIITRPQNLARLETRGIDFEATYNFPLLGGDASLRGFANYLDRYDTQTSAGRPILHRVGRSSLDTDGYGLPKWKGLLSQSWREDRFSVLVSERFTGSYVFGSPAQVFAAPIRQPNRTYVDANLSYAFGPDKNLETFVNVQNLFNVKPPAFPTLLTNLSVNADKAAYDVIGTYATIGARLRF